MDPATAHFLISPAGARVLARAREVRALPAHRRVDALRREAAAEHVRAALSQDALRCRAATRCPHAERLLFTEEALEQATAWPVAADRATRWPGASDAPLIDLTAGIGFDTLATAASGRPVVACERDPVRALLLTFNAEALALASRIDVRTVDAREAVADGLTGPLALLDPSRRPGGRRTRAPEAFEPPLDAWEGLLAPFGAALVKLPPTQRDLRPDDLPGPEEVVSLAGRARERRLYQGGAFGELPPRRATRLPDGASVSGPGTPWPQARAPQEGDWLLDPDVSVTLAGLVGDLAAQQDLRPVHPQIAYLLGTEPIAGLPGHGMRIEAVLPPRAGALNRWLADQGVGALTLRSRGVADAMATWRKRLRPRGRVAGTLVFTRGPSDRWVVLAGRTVPMTGE